MIQYIILPHSLIASKTTSGTEKIFLGLIAVLTRKGTYPTDVTDAFIASHIGVGRVQCNRIVRKFKEAGVLKVYKEFGRRNIELIKPDLIVYKFDKKEKKEYK